MKLVTRIRAAAGNLGSQESGQLGIWEGGFRRWIRDFWRGSHLLDLKYITVHLFSEQGQEGCEVQLARGFLDHLLQGLGLSLSACKNMLVH